MAIAVALLPDVVLAQKRSCAPESLRARLGHDEALALNYAPAFWFAPGERYFPTLPFFPAFDAGRQFHDLAQVAPHPGARLSWNRLDSLYATDDTSKARRSAIFYRVRKLSEGQKTNIFRYLKSDEQAWDRFNIDRTVRDRLESDGTHFQVIEYYAYYLNDLGLVGHPHDIEFVYVFVPQDTALARRFRIVVGAGHTSRTPNNVLVSTGESSGVMVELGDHSNAPDRHPYGVFIPGLDANWHAYDVWGTRDLQSSAGLSAFGSYELAMTFPRDSTSMRLFPHRAPDTLVAVGFHSSVPGNSARPSRLEYSLVPAEAFACLHDRLARRPAPGGQAVDSFVSLTVDYGSWNWGFTGLNHLTDAMKDTAATYMRAWNDPLQCAPPRCKARHGRIAPVDFQPWKHSQYAGDPTDVFKRDLFRPVFGAAPILSLLRYWLTWQPGNAALVEGGFEVPAKLPLWRKVPVRIPGYLEVHVGGYTRCRDLVNTCGALESLAGSRSRRVSPVISLLHTGHYNRAITYYLRYSWITDRHRVDGDTSATSVLGGGVSLVPASLHWPNWPIINSVCSLRVRIGLATGVHRTGPRLGDARWEIQLSPLSELVPMHLFKNPACA